MQYMINDNDKYIINETAIKMYLFFTIVLIDRILKSSCSSLLLNV